MKKLILLALVLAFSGCTKVTTVPLPRLAKAPKVEGVAVKFVDGHLDVQSTKAILPVVKKLRGSVKFYENQIDKYNKLR